MKAVQYSTLGSPDVLQYVEVPDPQISDDEVLIDVAYAGINHTDIHFRKGIPGVDSPIPHIPGCDASGTIQEVGKNVANVKPGDRVYINPAIFCKKCEYCQNGKSYLCRKQQLIGRETNGSYAQLLKVPSENVHTVPPSVELSIAAACPLVYLTAYSMVVSKAKVQEGETVLIMGAGSGVSMAAIQIAKLLGATVITTASLEEKCKKAIDILGADHVIQYTKEDLNISVKQITKRSGVDVVIDHVGGKQWVPLLQSLKNGGRLVTCGATAGYNPQTDLRHIFFRQLTIMGSTMGTPQELNMVMQWVFEGKLTPHIDTTFPLKDAVKAHQYIESRKSFGKVLLKI